MREVTMTTRNVCAVRLFIANVSEGDAGRFSEMAHDCGSLNIQHIHTDQVHVTAEIVVAVETESIVRHSRNVLLPTSPIP